MSGGPPPMPAPVCLIENTDQGLQTVESALNLLRSIQQPVVVVAVVGLYRTGKSYLMNRLAQQQSGFALGSTIESKTKGIWMWCVPHPMKKGHTLVLLDTEGLGDVDKGDEKNDAWIFCLAVLLSSTLVYNSRGTIDNQAIEKLHYVTELTDQIQVKSAGASEQDDDEMAEECEFVRFFPSFVWAVRDFTLERKINGRNVSDDEYLNFALQLKNGLSPKVMTYNLPRQCIRSFFPTRKCFTFPFPTAANNMSHLDSMAEADLDPDFRNVADSFCTHIFTESRVKTVQGGHKVTGSRFSHLVKIYVDTINSGKVPCLENAVVAMAEIENQSAVDEGFRLYVQGMENLKKNFPVDLESLSAEHQRASALATQEFLKRSFKDTEGKYMTQLQENVAKLYDQLINDNMDASEKLCRKLLSDLYAPMAGNIQQGIYAKPGGYEIYCRDRDAMVAKYRQDGKKGMKGEEMLEGFLQERSAEANSIMKADEKLTEADKQRAEEAQKIALLEQENRMEEEKNKRLESLLEEEKRTHEENLNRLNEKLKQEYALLAGEQERALERKMAEQTVLLTQGFHQQEQELREQIQQLKKEQAQREAEEARLQREHQQQAAQATMQVLGNTLETYYNYKQKKEDRRLQQVKAQKEKYTYKKRLMAAAKKVGMESKVTGVLKAGASEQTARASEQKSD
ncbi:guanylate-binding protein 1-like isoform X1 [Alosa sapidissima]|uniref:guanylate-binding protein 1-like isoform X1 n=1 Tax=Alosa sapidissima TaxID=34773 RepID=UPI001C09C50A|nr:guanylate-binding protein 1-like isoform X1 [Alosa sapidissima]